MLKSEAIKTERSPSYSPQNAPKHNCSHKFSNRNFVPDNSHIHKNSRKELPKFKSDNQQSTHVQIIQPLINPFKISIQKNDNIIDDFRNCHKTLNLKFADLSIPQQNENQQKNKPLKKEVITPRVSKLIHQIQKDNKQ